MQQTENYKLEIYETGDAAALTDGYNLSMYKLDEYLTTQQDQLDNHETRITSLEERMDTAEEDIDALEERMTAAEGRLDTAEKDIDALETRMDNAETRLDGHDVDITNITSNLTVVHGDIDALQERVTVTETRLDEHDTELAQIQTDLDTAENAISVLNTWYTTEISPVLTNHETRIDDQETLLELLTTRVSNTEGRLEVHDDEIELLQTRVGRLEPQLLWDGAKEATLSGESNMVVTWSSTEFTSDIRPFRQILIYGYIKISGEANYNKPVTITGWHNVDSGIISPLIAVSGQWIYDTGDFDIWGTVGGYVTQTWTQESQETQTLGDTTLTLGPIQNQTIYQVLFNAPVEIQKVYGIGQLEVIAA